MDTLVPLQLIVKIEGFWGAFVYLTTVYLLVNYLLYDGPFNTWYMLAHSTYTQMSFAFYFISIFFHSVRAVTATFLLNYV